MANSHIRALEPTALWEHFCDLNEKPRPSYGEQNAIEMVLEFAKKHGLTARKDKSGNVAIEKKATKGMDDRQTVILQAHLDMVTEPKEHANWSRPIPMFLETEGENAGWISARETTLGADNGIGVAAALALLASKNIPHPPLVGLFTVTEEVGLVGARALDPRIVRSGAVLLNMDTEDENELCISCAGGIGTEVSQNFKMEKTDPSATAFEISIDGLIGGHSGADIHLNRGNANKLMGRLLYPNPSNFGLKIAEIDGGGLRNVIPRSSTATVFVSAAKAEVFQKEVEKRAAEIAAELKKTEPNFSFSIKKCSKKPAESFSASFTKRLLQAVASAPNGVFRMSPDVEGLVETSSNLARVAAKNGTLFIEFLSRSARESGKAEVAAGVRAALEANGFKLKNTNSYPGWPPNPASPILKVSERVFEEVFSKKPHVMSIHAGLECGVIVEKMKHLGDLDAISFGPNIRGAHSPDERVEVASVQKFWKFLLALLAETPKTAA